MSCSLPSKGATVTKLILAAAIAGCLSTPAFAQAIETPTSTTVVVPPGAPGVVTRPSGATGADGAVTYSPTGKAEDTISNSSAAGSNAGQPSRVGSPGGSGTGSNGGG